jgi:hypothetical protein
MVKHKDDYQVGQSSSLHSLPSSSHPSPHSEGIVGWTLVHDCPNESHVLSRNYVQGLPANARVSLLK